MTSRVKTAAGGAVAAALVLVPGVPTVLAHESDINGTEGSDCCGQIDGHEHADVIHARGGDDSASAFAGGDKLYGQDGDDVAMTGGGGQDLVDGGRGNDTLRGGDGDDDLNGDESGDYILGGQESDVLGGNEGADTLDSENDGHFDRNFGGDGGDVCFVDSFDASESCERRST